MYLTRRVRTQEFRCLRRVRLRDMRDEMRDEGGESKLSTQYSNTLVYGFSIRWQMQTTQVNNTYTTVVNYSTIVRLLEKILGSYYSRIRAVRSVCLLV